jgi:hypothetical protein
MTKTETFGDFGAVEAAGRRDLARSDESHLVAAAQRARIFVGNGRQEDGVWPLPL